MISIRNGKYKPPIDDDRHSAYSRWAGCSFRLELGHLRSRHTGLLLHAPMSAVSVSGRNFAFETECIGFFAEVVQVLGVPKSIGQIYGLIFASPAPLSFTDIVARLEISKGSASQGLQLLRSLGAIKLARSLPLNHRALRLTPDVPVLSPVELPRRDYYEPELSLRKLVSGVLGEKIMPLAMTGGDRLARLRELAEQDGERSDFLLDRVKQLGTWRRRLRTVLPVLTALLGPKSQK